MTASAPKKRRGFWLFFPFFLMALLIGLYSAYWFWGQNRLNILVDDFIAAERAAGHTIEYSDKSIGGFPYRFELTVNDPVYEDDEIVPTRWEGQQLQLVMQPWNWFHYIGRSPGMNHIRTGGQDISLLLGPTTAASVSFDSQFAMQRFSLAIDEAASTVDGEPVVDLDTFEFHLRPAPDDATMLMVETHWQALEIKSGLPDEFAAMGSAFGPSILRLEADQAVTLLNEGYQVAELPPLILARGGEIRVPQLILNLAGAELGVRGVFKAFDGQSMGTLGLRLENANALLGMVRMAAGEALDPQTQQLIAEIQAASIDGGFLEFDIRPDGLYQDGVLALPADLGGGS